MTKPLHVIYIPGLGDEVEPKGQIWAVARWNKYGVEPEVFRVRWGDKEAWAPKFVRLLARIDEVKAEGKDVGLIGASAGASAVINAFAARKDKIAGVVLIAGKVNRPDAINRLHYVKNPAMPESVKQCVESLQKLGPEDRQHILSRYGIFDEVVVKADSYIPDAHNHRTLSAVHLFNIATQLTFGAHSAIRFLKRQAANIK